MTGFQATFQELSLKKSRNSAKTMKSVQRAATKIVSDPNWRCFREAVSRANVYAEWGTGASTFYVLQHGIVNVLSLETDKSWANLMGHNSQARVKHVDVGAVGEWGWPESYAKRENFIEYIEGPFRNGEGGADMLFVDGRFRVSCFLSALLHSTKGTVIVFDDYVSRGFYRLVEEFISPVSTHGRQALFEVPSKLNLAEIRAERDKFLYVMA